MSNTRFKFRGYDAETCEIVDLQEIMLDANYQYYFNSKDDTDRVPTSTIMQFTGLTDYTGREVYSGDIIDNLTFGDSPCPASVVFEDGSYRKNYPDWDRDLPKPILDADDIKLLELEVIGNIYQQPGLMEQQA